MDKPVLDWIIQPDLGMPWTRKGHNYDLCNEVIAAFLLGLNAFNFPCDPEILEEALHISVRLFGAKQFIRVKESYWFQTESAKLTGAFKINMPLATYTGVAYEGVIHGTKILHPIAYVGKRVYVGVMTHVGMYNNVPAFELSGHGKMSWFNDSVECYNADFFNGCEIADPTKPQCNWLQDFNFRNARKFGSEKHTDICI